MRLYVELKNLEQDDGLTYTIEDSPDGGGMIMQEQAVGTHKPRKRRTREQIAYVGDYAVMKKIPAPWIDPAGAAATGLSDLSVD